MNWFIVLSTLFVVLGSALAGPPVTLLSNQLLDSRGIYFVSYDGLVNVNSFQLSGVLTWGQYQYAAWYTGSSYATIGRRLVNSTAWNTVQLNHRLKYSDSHNVIALGVSPEDGRLHVAMDCHSDTMFYTVSSPGSVNNADWHSGLFGSIVTRLGNLNIGSTITYPQFLITPQNKLQFVYRTRVSGNGDVHLAEYSSGSWNQVGLWASSGGSYNSPVTGAVSYSRNLYIHGITYHGNRLHATGTWREQNSAVMCSGGGLTNHDTIYVYSDDYGRNWKNNAGASIGSTTNNPIAIWTSGLVIDSLDPNHGLMNQESQAVDSRGLIHAIISYVPGRFGQCVTNYASNRIASGYAFHVYANSQGGSFTKMEIPYPIEAVGRSQIAFDKSDNVYVVLPFLRIVSASSSSGWRDWSMVYDGRANGLNVFGEVIVDRERLRSGDGILSVLYQERSTGTTPSPVRVVDFRLG